MKPSCILVTLLSVSIILIITIYILKLIIIHRRNGCTSLRLPPCPLSLPIVGHLHLVSGPLPHRSLQTLAAKHGPIIGLSFGSRYVVVVSSPAAAKDCFTKQNDVILANRPTLDSRKHLSFGSPTLLGASYGHHWRHLRKLFMNEYSSQSRLDASFNIRQEQVKSMVKSLVQALSGSNKSSSSWAKVEMKSRTGELTFGSMLKTAAGRREVSEEATELRVAINGVFQFGADPADYIPILKWISYQNHRLRDFKKWAKKLDELLQSLLDRNRTSAQDDDDDDDDDDAESRSQSVIGNLLTSQKNDPESYSDEVIKGMILMTIGGSNTVHATIEWALSLLLNHPSSLAKAKVELDEHVGENRLVEESDLPKLTYLKSIINETLRLYPPGPLLVPHYSSKDCNIGGFDVPSGTMVLVNAWAIHRDPKVWEDPLSFRPERFDNNENNGDHHYKLIPFGAGRRACPGISMAYRIVGSALAALIQCFEWERTSEDQVDMREVSGLTMIKAVPLEAMCRPRKAMVRVFNELGFNV